MIIQCPTCGQVYDTTGYPAHYQFVCNCGMVIDVAAYRQHASMSLATAQGASGAYSSSSSSHPDSTMRTSPPVVAPSSGTGWTHGSSHPDWHADGSDNLDHTLAPRPSSSAHIDPFAEDDYPSDQEGESTAVTRSPYHQQPPSSPPEAVKPPSWEDAIAPSAQTPPSWDDIPNSTDQNLEDIHLPDENPPERMEFRSLLALFFSLFFIFGPLVWLLGWASRRQIRLTPNVFRGKSIATFAMFLGLIQTGLLAALLYAAVTRPHIHPIVTSVAHMLGILQVKLTEDTFAEKPTDAEELSLSVARRELLRYTATHSKNSKPHFVSLYLYQEPNHSHAHAYWYDPPRRKTQRALFLRSNRGHWHLNQIEIAYQEESRVFGPGSRQLTTPQAKQFIQQFWKLRGRFTNVHIHQLYVVQRPGAKKAIAYWKLHKQISPQSIKTWDIATHFRRSSENQWHLCQYASSTREGELHQYAATAPPTLTPEIAKPLLAEFMKEEKKKAFSARFLSIYQEPESHEAWALWQPRSEKQSMRSLFRYATTQQWHLALEHIPPAIETKYRLKAPVALTTGVARQILLSHLGRTKTESLQHLYVYQQSGQHRADVNWQISTAPPQAGIQAPPSRRYRSLFTYTQDGFWNLTEMEHAPAKEVIYYQKGDAVLKASVVKRLIRQYWKDQSWRTDLRRFSGAKIRDLYVYQDPESTKAWAHWTIENNDQITALHSSFFRSSDGNWYLGDYDLGQGYMLSYHQVGPARLTVSVAMQLLLAYWKQKDKDIKTDLRNVYVYQPPNKFIAYVHTLVQQNQHVRPVLSLFHRSTQNRWYLSVVELPHPPSL